MPNRPLSPLLAALAILLIAGCEKSSTTTTIDNPAPAPQPGGTLANAGAYKISGPYTHQNLSIFLFHGADTVKDKKFLTLQEAMEQKKVTVHETGQVNELSIENVSNSDEVYVQAGDIVKGGKQDRVIAVDFIVPANSGKMPINSFCVESGRWQQRGGENVNEFASSAQQAPSKELKLAAKQAGNQGEVWQKVADSQKKLAENVKAEVRAGQSQSSLQLTLENKEVQKTTDEYIKKLKDIIKDKPDVVGYAFSINGEVNSADTYASHDLFVKLWPKLLQASATEAIGEVKEGQTHAEAKVEAVTACIADAEKGKKTEKAVSKRVKMETAETKDNVRFRTYDEHSKSVIHENIVKK
jgi:hypothetical protein